MNLTCCVSCGWGSSESENDVPKQVEKHGEYICIKCEEGFNKLLESNEELKLKNGFGTSETLITADRIYYFEADRSRVMNPKAPFLGFGGSWFLITKDYKTKYGTERKISVSNNLFLDRRIPKSYQEKFKEKGKINAMVIGVNKESLISLRNLLNGIPYLN